MTADAVGSSAGGRTAGRAATAARDLWKTGETRSFPATSKQDRPGEHDHAGIPEHGPRGPGSRLRLLRSVLEPVLGLLPSDTRPTYRLGCDVRRRRTPTGLLFAIPHAKPEPLSRRPCLRAREGPVESVCEVHVSSDRERTRDRPAQEQRKQITVGSLDLAVGGQRRGRRARSRPGRR